MKNRKILMVLVMAASISFSCGGGGVSGYEPDETAYYLLTFTSTWSAKTYPQDFPTNPHFSGLIGAVHNENATFWKEGQIASPGIKQVAETGSKDGLADEVASLIIDGSAYVKLSGDEMPVSPGTVTMRFTAHRDYHLITFVSKLAPSPDWFVGISGMSLMEKNDWIIEKAVELYVYDAGTDSGTTYTAEDQPTNPPEKIRKITGYPFLVEGKIVPVGRFSFLRL